MIQEYMNTLVLFWFGRNSKKRNLVMMKIDLNRDNMTTMRVKMYDAVSNRNRIFDVQPIADRLWSRLNNTTNRFQINRLNRN